MEKLIIHENIKKKLIGFIQNNKVPHIIFCGPNGSGKRGIVKYFINKIYQNDTEKLKQYIMYVNCAHGKGIRFIRDQLKFFAKTNIQNNKGCFFKSIILLNADFLTTDAQSALRRCIELFSHTTRFFIIISDVNKLLNPILSRFCNINIPLPIINNKMINLYEYNKSLIFSINKEKKIWLNKKMKNVKIKTLQDCIKFVIILYEKGYNSLNLFDFIENKLSLPLKKKYKYLLFFDKIKKEFRNEKLLMFYIIYIIFLRHDIDI
tara:strand:- start:751 stop:1539 length:789 start_codon:yes stop_codon:yes gene_type:complete